MLKFKNIKNVKKIYSGLAGLLCVTIVGTTIHFSNQKVHAKDTFQGITEIVEDNSLANPFQIVELVPGRSSFVVESNDGTEPMTVDASLGEMGYYIDGAEPAGFEENIKKIYSSEMRYNLADAYLKADSEGNLTGGALMPIASETDDNMAPLYFSAYDELYSPSENALYQMDEESNRFLDRDGKLWHRLEMEDPNEEQIVARKEMVPSLQGEYLKIYDPKKDERSAIFIKAAFVDFLMELTDTNHDNEVDVINLAYYAEKSVSGNHAGDFDPAVTSARDAGDYSVRFNKSSGKYGYKVKSTDVVYQGTYDEAGGNTDIYEKYVSNGKVYYQYIGKYSDVRDTYLRPAPSHSANGDAGNEFDEPDEEEPEDGDVEDEEEMPGDEEEIPGDEEEIEEPDPSEDEDDPSEDDDDDDIIIEDDEDDRPSAGHDTVKSKLDDMFDDIKSEEDIEDEEVEESEVVEDETNASEDDYEVENDDVLVEEGVVDTPDAGETPVGAAPETANTARADDYYYTVTFEYDNELEVDDDEYVYSVVSWNKIDVGSSDNAYTLDAHNVSNPTAFVRPNYSHEGALHALGTSDFVYEYKEPDYTSEIDPKFYGNYNMISGDETSDYLRVKNVEVYYKGIYENSNWFTQFVFDRDLETNTLNPFDNEVGYTYTYPSQTIYYSYSTVTPRELDNVQVANVGLLYISSGKGQLLPEKAEMPVYYGQKDADGDVVDISIDVVRDVIDAVANDDLPVMIDYSIFDNDELKGTNLYLLARVLQQADIKLFYKNYGQLSDAEFSNECWKASELFELEPTNHHVNKSVYVYDFSMHPENMANLDFILSSPSEYAGTGFDEIREQIDDENKYREVNNGKDEGGSKNYSEIPRDVNEAVAIKYIISYRGRRSANVKQSITILELQPGAVDCDTANDQDNMGHMFIEEDEDTNPTTYNVCIYGGTTPQGKHIDDSIILKGLKNEPTLVSMSTSEFVGRDADLNATYDLIYIGLSTQNFNTENGRTVYNDENMNGLMYVNIGDKVRAGNQLMGLLNDQDSADTVSYKGYSESNNTGVHRGPGNDLTRYREKALEEYVDGGYPVICAYNCFVGELDNELEVYDGVNSDKRPGDKRGYIDNCSQMYQFLNYARREYGVNKENFIRLTENNEVPTNAVSNFDFYLNLPKPVISLDPSITKLDNYSDAVHSGGKFYLDYRFQIKDKRSTDEDESYDLAFYMDINNDGKYSDSEKQTDLTISNSNGDKVSKSSGKYALKLGKTYKLRVEVPAERVGPIAWKLKIMINQTKNMKTRIAKARRDEVVGVHVIRREDEGKRWIHILQILPDNPEEKTWNIEKTKGGTNRGDFKDIFAQQAGGDYTLYDENGNGPKTLSCSEFINAVTENPNYMDAYSLVVLGFSEHNNIFEDMISNGDYDHSLLDKYGSDENKKIVAAKAAAKVHAWIKGGKATLIGADFIAHTYKEKTQYIGGDGESQDKWWGYETTKRFRTMVGMDRYGILQREGSGDVNERMGDQMRSGSYSLDDIRGLNSYGVAYGYVPNSDKEQMARETQGYTNLTLNAFKTPGSGWATNAYAGHFVGLNDAQGTKGPESLKFQPSGDDSLYQGRLNIGVITMYPNPLTERAASANHTKLPIISLDLDGDDDFDGQPDVTVWFASSSGTKSVKAMSTDARNLYYVYTKRNVTFVNGLLTPNGTSMPELMVNAVISAFESGLKGASVHIVDGPSTDANDISTIYVPYENLNDDESINGPDQPVYYFSSGTNDAQTTLLSRYYYSLPTFNEDTAGVTRLDMGGDIRYVKPLYSRDQYRSKDIRVTNVKDNTIPTYMDFDGDAVRILPDGKTETYHYDHIWGAHTYNKEVYDIEVPLSLMGDSTSAERYDNMTVYVEVLSVVPNASDSEEPSVTYSYDTVDLIKTELFTLD